MKERQRKNAEPLDTSEMQQTADQMNQKARKTMETAVLALQDKKARNPQVIDISKVTTVAKYFVIASGTSNTHLKALADTVEDKLKEIGENHYRCNGKNSARWILLDYSEVVVHLFLEEDRTFYALERLWRDGDTLNPEQLAAI